MVRNILRALGEDITPPFVGHGFVNDLLEHHQNPVISPEGDNPYRPYFQKTEHCSKVFFPSVGLHSCFGLRFIPTRTMRAYKISDLFVLRVVLVV